MSLETKESRGYTTSATTFVHTFGFQKNFQTLPREYEVR
jgi:hypothetical protein